MDVENTIHKNTGIMSDEFKKIVPSKKELKRIDWTIVHRLMVFLHYNSKTKKTILAMKCNMSYDKCVMYLDFLSKKEFINKKTENGFELICLSTKGTELFKLLEDSKTDIVIQ
jgi:predicted transcriptional regulator